MIQGARSLAAAAESQRNATYCTVMECKEGTINFENKFLRLSCEQTDYTSHKLHNNRPSIHV